jgi:hypothetical protein
VVVETTTLPQGRQPVRADVVDVGTGGSEPLVEFRGNVPHAFAAQVWSAQVVDAPEPPFAPDRRLVGVSLAVALLVLVRVGLAVRRRRGRP